MAKKKKSFAAVVLVVLICCALAFGLSVLLRKMRVQTGLGSITGLDIPYVEKLVVLDEGFVCYDGSALIAYNEQAKAKWSYDIGGGVSFTADTAGVAAWSGQTLTLIDGSSGNSLYRADLGKPIIGARIGSKYTCVIMGEDEFNPTVCLMENGGRQVNQIELSGMLVADSGFYSTGSLLWLLNCDTSGSVPSCTVQTYSPGKSIVGSISDGEQLIYKVLFQTSQICCVGEKYMRFYDYTGTEDSSKRELVYGWYLADYDASQADPLLLFVNDAQYNDGTIQDIRLMRSNKDKLARLPFPCTAVYVREDTVYGFASSGYVMTMGLSDTSAEAFQLSIPLDKVYGIMNNGVAVVNSSGNVYLVGLK